MPEWFMFAEAYRDMLLHLGDERYARMYAGENGTVVPARVAEVALDDETGTHWGWLRAGRTEPEMVQPRRNMLEMCFEYGSVAEEQRGHGRVVRLRVVPVPMASEAPGV